jgi:His-Xaa-Ser system radical SAM maturase HxsB
VHLAVSATGDHTFLLSEELRRLQTSPVHLPLERLAELRARGFLKSASPTPGMHRLAASLVAAKRETVQSGPALHIIVPTLQCSHSCRYCQVSRSLGGAGHTMSEEALSASCQCVFESAAETLTVEFQGGDPLLRFDLVRWAVLRILELNRAQGRRLRFVVASTLHQLNDEMCSFFKEHNVFLSTSVDGPAALHNKNRPLPTRDAYERTIVGLKLARSRLGQESVSALMTTTSESLENPEAIVDEYVRLGFTDVFLRPLSSYGFAKRNQLRLSYSLAAFAEFYERALDRVLYWNRQGVELREVYASIILNKVLATFDGGFVDLQSPTGSGLSVLVYNYDGYVYPSDEARMLAETGDKSLRLGEIGQSLSSLLNSSVQQQLVRASLTEFTPGCITCAYRLFCAPNPVEAQAQFGTPFAPVHLTDHCQRHMAMFDSMFSRLHEADEWTLDLFYRWAMPVAHLERTCAE